MRNARYIFSDKKSSTHRPDATSVFSKLRRAESNVHICDDTILKNSEHHHMLFCFSINFSINFRVALE